MEANEILKFQEMIFNWWELNKRDLPWRHTRDPYKILVSEIMLQQTQVLRVVPAYEKFLYFFPDVYTLASATPAKILRVWKGMGYNRRALYLHKAAKIIVDQHNNQFPVSEQQLSKLPGVGTYTARALLVFAFGKNIAAVDTNIRQIIMHFFFHDRTQKPSIIQEAADQLMPVGESWEWHQALMDYGALEMPKLKLKKLKKKAEIPFKQTNRFYRGRLVDILRDGPVDERILLNDFSASVIAGLIHDGLVERRKRRLRLPADSD
jgi:A/G-specific adenine glycosylase